MFKKLIALCLVLAVFSAGCAQKQSTSSNLPASFAALSKGDIVIIYTNDVHCGVRFVKNSDGEISNFGYAEVAGLVDTAEAIVGADYVTLVDAGDAMQGDAIGSLSKGSYIVDIMNATGYDVFVLGNHEFDYGMEQMNALMSNMKPAVVSANFTNLSTNTPVYEPYTLMQYGDTTVAFVGITTPEAYSKSSPTYFQDDKGNFLYGLAEGNNGADLYKAVQVAVDAAAKEADYVVAIGHLGIDNASAPWRSVDVIANTRGIDAFIDGHSHSTVEADYINNIDGETVLLTQTGTKLDNIGMLTISPEGEIDTQLIAEPINTDAEVQAFVDNIMAEFDTDLARIVAITDVALAVNDPSKPDTRIIRSQETNLGDFVADAYRFVLGADIGIVNGGGIRAAIDKGDISFGEVIAVHPFNNSGMVVEATGQEILDALELSVRAVPDENGGFLHVSGLTFSVDTSIASTVQLDDRGSFTAVNGKRRVQNVRVAGKTINPKAIYTVAGHNYMLMDGGDGINMFRDNKIVVQPVILDNQILIQYIQENLKGIIGKEYANPYGQKRITIN
ncbi:MAG: bifunctional metallophosphatase/5'-nucleotidase [Deferribacteraceae bacterium]|jgi:2',3'-cyclic-nucleotide 2'-phosphodiesterase (5'-nucleotidase family)|nr:bifunctional metallophosphatase/5'-nucleotidase [Deferribacteraceae bacterium]